MKAVVEIGGLQYPVEEKMHLTVGPLKEKEGAQVTFKRVLLLQDGDTAEYGKPYLKALVTATVLRHLRLPKVVSRTYRRRKGRHRTYGHRQPATEISIKSIAKK